MELTCNADNSNVTEGRRVKLVVQVLSKDII